MNQEDKKLLLKDLSIRLPYRVKGRVYAECSNGEYDMNGDMIFFDSPFDVTLDDINISTEEIHVIAIGNEDTVAFIEDQQIWGSLYTVDEFKPYLRPMSSMTKEEFESLKEYSELKYNQLDLTSFQNGDYKCLDFYLNEIPSGAVIRVFDWLNKYHFDYRDLIQMDLAIEVTKENNPYKS